MERTCTGQDSVLSPSRPDWRRYFCGSSPLSPCEDFFKSALGGSLE